MKTAAIATLALALAAFGACNREGSKSSTPDVAARDAENTAKNARDREGSTLTPMDQGNSESDLTITQQVRQAIMDQESFSTNAKNVKVITVNGVVTLRGPVNDDSERTEIAALARKVAGVERVDNQLEVAP